VGGGNDAGHFTLRNVAIAAIATFVVYAEYVVWIKSPTAQVTTICDNLRALKEVTARNIEPPRVIDEASAATLEPWHLIAQAVRACDGEAIDIEDSNVRRRWTEREAVSARP
jgi:hypothetical protein